MTEIPAAPCSLHRVHSPKNLTVEWHHLVCVAWQLRTPVSMPPFPGIDTSGRGMLWDDRGAWICPTGHRSTHHLIVAMMRAILAGAADDTAAYATLTAAERRMPESTIARQALIRFVAESGASLHDLAATGELGQS